MISLISNKVHRLWVRRKKQFLKWKFKYFKDLREKKEAVKKVIRYECKESCHFINECPKPKKESFKKWIWRKKRRISYAHGVNSMNLRMKKRNMQIFPSWPQKSPVVELNDRIHDNDEFEIFSKLFFDELINTLSELLNKI